MVCDDNSDAEDNEEERHDDANNDNNMDNMPGGDRPATCMKLLVIVLNENEKHSQIKFIVEYICTMSLISRDGMRFEMEKGTLLF